jgi:hypothetical protein
MTLGPALVGVASDLLADVAGAAALRYSLLAIVASTLVLAAVQFARAGFALDRNDSCFPTAAPDAPAPEVDSGAASTAHASR